MKPTTLLTGSGILIAILLVWASLWTTTAQIYKENNADLLTVGFGLVYVYWAILGSVVAFIATMLKRAVGRFALASLLFSLVVTGIEILGSLIAVTVKMLTEQPLFEPAAIFVAILEWLPRCVSFVVIPVLIILICVALVYRIPKTKEFFGNLIDDDIKPKVPPNTNLTTGTSQSGSKVDRGG